MTARAQGSTPASVSFDLTNDGPPLASAGGPYTIAQGGSLALSAAESSDPNGLPLSYSWTINGHAGATSGVNPTLTWARLQALGLDVGAGTFASVITVQVSDGVAAAVTASANLTINDTPPVPAIGVLPSGTLAAGSPMTLTASVTDVSTAETAAGFDDLWEVSAGTGQTVVAAQQLNFDGKNPVPLPSGLIAGATSLTVEVTFQTSSDGVILGYQNQPAGTTPNAYMPALYVGSNGLLYAEIFDGSFRQMVSSTQGRRRPRAHRGTDRDRQRPVVVPGRHPRRHARRRPEPARHDVRPARHRLHGRLSEYVRRLLPLRRHDQQPLDHRRQYSGRLSLVPDEQQQSDHIHAARTRGLHGRLVGHRQGRRHGYVQPEPDSHQPNPRAGDRRIARQQPGGNAGHLDGHGHRPGTGPEHRRLRLRLVRDGSGRFGKCRGARPGIESQRQPARGFAQRADCGRLDAHRERHVSNDRGRSDPRLSERAGRHHAECVHAGLYVGSNGLLYAEIFDGSFRQMVSSKQVDDGSLHTAELIETGSSQLLYVDGTLVGDLLGTPNPLNMTYDQIGTGYTVGYTSAESGYFPFTGTISSVSITAAGPPALGGSLAGYVALAGSTGSQLTFTPPDTGPYTIELAATDAAGLTGYQTETFSPTDVTPSINVPAAVVATQGTTFTLSGSFKDAPGDGPWYVDVNYGDKTPTQYAISLSPNSQGVDDDFTLSHVYANAGLFDEKVTLINGDDQIVQATIQVTVSGFSVNDGSPQRSMVTSLTYTFPSPSQFGRAPSSCSETASRARPT